MVEETDLLPFEFPPVDASEEGMATLGSDFEASVPVSSMNESEVVLRRLTGRLEVLTLEG